MLGHALPMSGALLCSTIKFLSVCYFTVMSRKFFSWSRRGGKELGPLLLFNPLYELGKFADVSDEEPGARM